MITFTFISLLLNIVAGPAQVPAGNSLQLVVKEDVFVHPPFKSCHAPTICDLGNGSLLVGWFGGAYEGSADVSIWAARRTATGWTAPLKIADGLEATGSQQACWNPVLFMDNKGLLYLHFKVGKDPRHWQAFYKTSSNKGLSWSDAKKLPDSLLGPIKNKPLQLNNGDILYPSSRESADEKLWTAHIEKSNASASRWTIHPIAGGNFGIIQPTLLRYKNGRIQALCRSRQNTVVQSWSDDEGEHWSPATALDLPNPNSGIDAVSLRTGTQLLVYNPMKAGSNWWEGRSVLKIASSTDGVHWTDVFTLENELSGEYSYPAIIVDRQQRIHIVYTAKRETIRYVEVR